MPAAVPSSTTSRRLPIRQPRLAFSSQPTFFAKLHNRNLTIATSIPTSLSPSLLALRSQRQLQLPPATMTSNIGIPIKLLHEATVRCIASFPNTSPNARVFGSC